MRESSAPPPLSRRALIRDGALGAAGIAALGSSAGLSSSSASASAGTPPAWTNVIPNTGRLRFINNVEPLWGDRPLALLQEFVAGGGRAVVTCVDTDRLDAAWLGRVVDESFVDDIAGLDVDPCGENGEYHSFAFAGPAFVRPLPWRPAGRRSDGRFVQLDVLPG
jgi:Diphthamide synthase